MELLTRVLSSLLQKLWPAFIGWELSTHPYLIGQGALAAWTSESLVGLLIVAALVFYTVNTFMVATVLCLIEHKPLRSMLQGCYFWSSMMGQALRVFRLIL